MNKLAMKLIIRGNDFVTQPYKKIVFSQDQESDTLLNDLQRFPHAFVLGCLMNRQSNAQKTWMIPFKVKEAINGFDLTELYQLSLDEVMTIFFQNKLHRLHNRMAKIFYLAVDRINHIYQGDASKIWEKTPSSATVVRRFLEFFGCGPRMASNTTNILYRDFKIPLKDRYSIDVSPDRQLKKVLKRTGLVSKYAKPEEYIYLARELHPEYPGVFDMACHEIAVKWCKSGKVLCHECYLNKICPKN